jgi:hypothetical protein
MTGSLRPYAIKSGICLELAETPTVVRSTNGAQAMRPDEAVLRLVTGIEGDAGKHGGHVFPYP